MANQYLLDSVLQGIAVQGSNGSPSTTASDYKAFLSNALPPQIPRSIDVDDTAMVGDGYSRTTRDSRLYYWDEKTMQIGGLLNDHIAGILMKGFLAGTATVTPRTAPSNDIGVVQKVSNVTPLLYSIFRQLGGEYFILGDFFINAFNISQEGEAQPTASFDLLSTGFFRDKDYLDALGTPFNPANVVAAPTYNYFHGAALVFTMTDGVETYNLTADGDLISTSLEGSNNGRTAKRPGDSFQGANNNTGAFARNSVFGRATGMGRIKVDLKSDLRYFKSKLAQRTLTGATWKWVGFDKIGATTDYYEFEMKIPRAKFGVIDGDTDQDYGALSLEIMPQRDAVTKGLFTARIRTDKTLI